MQATSNLRRPSLAAPPSPAPSSASSSGADGVTRMAAENPVLVVGQKGCFMILVVRRLLQGLGVNPVVFEVGEDGSEDAAVVKDMMTEMEGRAAGQMLFPAVFIGGKLVGGIDKLMAVHISGELVPILKDAGAIWL